MARMVFGQWQTGDGPARPEHARGRVRTLCNIDLRRHPGTLVYGGNPALTGRMVTCLRCRSRLDLAALAQAEAAHFAALATA